MLQYRTWFLQPVVEIQCWCQSMADTDPESATVSVLNSAHHPPQPLPSLTIQYIQYSRTIHNTTQHNLSLLLYIQLLLTPVYVRSISPLPLTLTPTVLYGQFRVPSYSNLIEGNHTAQSKSTQTQGEPASLPVNITLPHWTVDGISIAAFYEKKMQCKMSWTVIQHIITVQLSHTLIVFSV